VDLERVEKLLSLFERSRARELRVEADGWRIAMRRGLEPGSEAGSAGSRLELPAPELAPPAPPTVTITAPLVGIFREAGTQLETGDRIQAGTPVGAIESMKILSPVVAPADGLVTEVLVEDGHPVEYGEPLFLLRPLEEGEEEEEGS
jgi:biotin carboxyl carrier protein